MRTNMGTAGERWSDERSDALAERGKGELVREPLGAPPDEAALVPPGHLVHGVLRRGGDVAQPRRQLQDLALAHVHGEARPVEHVGVREDHLVVEHER